MTTSLVLTRHISFLPLESGLVLCGHAFKGPRNVVDLEQRAHLDAFRWPTEVDAYVQRHGGDAAGRELLTARIAVWYRQGLLVDASTDEDRVLAREFGSTVDDVRGGVRRAQMRSLHDPRTRGLVGAAPVVPAPVATWKVVYLGLCLVLPGLDGLIELASRQGIAVEGIGSFPLDVDLVAEQQPDFVVIGDLPRVGLGWRDTRPLQYVAEVRAQVAAVRARTAAPILVRNLIAPTCSLGGLADRGADSHINRVRALNVELAALAAELDEVYIVDIDQALSLAGKAGLVDDMVVLSHHLGSMTWLVERAHREPLASSAYDAAELLHAVGHPRERLAAEHVIAAEDLRVMSALRGVGRRKVVVVDLDETLWPGILAETGAPFPPDLAVDVYPHHLYLGLHEALLALRDRGILLACVSKNDREVVEALWKYPSTFDGLPRLTLADFVTSRIDWNDKADHLISIAAELDLAIETFAFIDDSPREREAVRERLPGVMVLGANPFGVRWTLLTDPAFQVPTVSDEARRRSEMVKGQLAREETRAVAADPAAFRASLDLRCTLRRETDETHLARVTELIHRTTQLNTTGERPSNAELRALTIYTLTAVDRFADYGLIGACIVDGDEIRQLVLSCRVIGLGLDELLLHAAAADTARRTGATAIHGRLIATTRNAPARGVFARAGFSIDHTDPQRWTFDTASPVPDVPYVITRDGVA